MFKYRNLWWWWWGKEHFTFKPSRNKEISLVLSSFSAEKWKIYVLFVRDGYGELRNEPSLDGTPAPAVSILMLGLVAGTKVVAKYLFVPSKYIQARWAKFWVVIRKKLICLCTLF